MGKGGRGGSALGPWLPPARVVAPALRLRNRLRRAHDRMVPPFASVVELTAGMVEVKLLAVAADLGVADALAAGPRTAAELAHELDADPDALDRALRFLASRGLFARDRASRYRNNAVSGLLRSDHPESMRAWARFVGSDWHWAIWNEAGHSVRTGKSGTEAATGTSYFDFVTRVRPDAGALFDEAMAATSRVQAQLLVRGYDFSGATHVCDVGGGTGNLLAGVLAAHPHLRGTLFDLPSLEPTATANLAAHGLADRCRFVGGDFFAEVPADADAYLLQAVVHDWDDESCVRILGNVRRALAPGGRVLVVETLVADDDQHEIAKLTDLLMLVLTGSGRERTAVQMRDLFARAGLRLRRDVVLPNLFHVFELEDAAP
jgi:SAM-dependent methyltransferase